MAMPTSEVLKTLGHDWPEHILNNLPGGLLTVDRDLRITYFNFQATQITGYSRKEALGRHCWEVLQGSQCSQDCALKEVMSSKSHEPVGKDNYIVSKSGRQIPVHTQTCAIFDQNGELLGAVESFSDMTRIRELEHERAQTLSLFAHDMKSPLISAAGLIKRLLAGKVGDLQPKQLEYLGIIKNDIEQVESLVLDFLDVARLHSTGSELVSVSLDPQDLLSELFRIFKSRAEHAGLDLVFNRSSTLPYILGDLSRLKRMFGNLLDNAIKYSLSGEVQLNACRNSGGELEVEVIDQGPGLTQEDIEVLFQPFKRGSAGRGVEGSGLGLAAVKSIALAHGGTVQAFNVPEGGACFVVTLPGY